MAAAVGFGACTPLHSRTPSVCMVRLFVFDVCVSFESGEYNRVEKGVVKESLLTISKASFYDPSKNVKYQVIDDVTQLRSEEDWHRVVAVFVLGAAWQFSDWPKKKWANPAAIFENGATCAHSTPLVALWLPCVPRDRSYVLLRPPCRGSCCLCRCFGVLFLIFFFFFSFVCLCDCALFFPISSRILSVCAFHLHFDDEALHPNIMQWRTHRLPVSGNGRVSQWAALQQRHRSIDGTHVMRACHSIGADFSFVSLLCCADAVSPCAPSRFPRRSVTAIAVWCSIFGTSSTSSLRPEMRRRNSSFERGDGRAEYGCGSDSAFVLVSTSSRRLFHTTTTKFNSTLVGSL